MNHPQQYPPPLSPIPADPLRGNSCNSRDPWSPMNPLTGIRATHRTTYGYREASPDGDSLPSRITATHPVVPQPIMNYESCIMHCYTFSAKEKDSETGLSYFGSRYYSSDLSIWLSVDPMSDKYPNESSYVYCGDNPLVFFDPDGKEKLIWINKLNNKFIASGAEKYQDDGAIHIFAHGSSRGLTVNINGENQTVRTAKQLDNLLSQYSEIWQNRNKEVETVIVLHSCRTGEGDNSFAEKVSRELGVTVVAPDQRVYYDNNGEIGTYKAKYVDQNNEYKLNENGNPKNKERSTIKGNWRVFQKGKETHSFKGDWHPREKPDILEIIRYCNY